ncbi:unnamed protein product [Discosporangium mesarthrocarpum]
MWVRVLMARSTFDQSLRLSKTNRSSKNCAAGDMEIKTKNSQHGQGIGQADDKEFIPAIKARMPGGSPSGSSRTVPSCTPGMGSLRPLRQWLGKTSCWEPSHPNSPDLSVFDLGFFQSIQRLKDDFRVTNVGKLVEATFEAFDDYPRETLGAGTAFLLSMAKR